MPSVFDKFSGIVLWYAFTVLLLTCGHIEWMNKLFRIRRYFIYWILALFDWIQVCIWVLTSKLIISCSSIFRGSAAFCLWYPHMADTHTDTHTYMWIQMKMSLKRCIYLCPVVGARQMMSTCIGIDSFRRFMFSFKMEPTAACQMESLRGKVQPEGHWFVQHGTNLDQDITKTQHTPLSGF